MIALIRSELLKIRTTKTWWMFTIAVLVFTGLALTLWIGFGNHSIDEATRAGQFEPPPPEANVPPEDVEQMRQQWAREHDLSRVLTFFAGNIYTSGQYFGLLFAVLLCALMITNEYFHQTATATFLTTPKRTKVIAAKLVTAVFASTALWLLTTAISITAGVIFFNAKGYDTQLGQWTVTRAILFNGLAYAAWGVLGVAFGVLIRNQIGAVITLAAGYMIGTQVVNGVAMVIYGITNDRWVLWAQVAWPSVASDVMISTERLFAGGPVWWFGALVLAAYAVGSGTLGTLIMRRRDIS